MRTTTAPILVAPLLVLLLASGARAQTGGPIEILSLMGGGDVVPGKVLTGAFGTAVLTMDLQNGNITFDVSAFNLPTSVSGAHIHVGSPGVGGPVLFDLRAVPRQAGDISVTGTLSAADLTMHANLGVRNIDDALQSIVGLATYIDVHTEGNPDGEVRGPLVISMAESTAGRVRHMLLSSAQARRR
ncbi:MAG: CHRD domain-containing protein [Acidobacteriota bacterium]|nr:CHRD domain-containing protein [Acidobacteriota bacterium]